MAEISNRQMSGIILIVMLVIFSNFLVCCISLSRVRRVSHDYVVTEDSFRRAVVSATTNYFASIIPSYTNVSPVQSSPANDVSVVLLTDLHIYYSYLHKCWVARHRGVDFYPGDYFPEGKVVGIFENRLYCRSDSGIVVIRPVPGEDGMGFPVSPPASPGRVEGGAL